MSDKIHLERDLETLCLARTSVRVTSDPQKVTCRKCKNLLAAEDTTLKTKKKLGNIRVDRQSAEVKRKQQRASRMKSIENDARRETLTLDTVEVSLEQLAEEELADDPDERRWG